MSEVVKTGRGGKRAGAGRPRNGFVGEMIERRGKSRATIYRTMRHGERVTPEAMAFASDPVHAEKITSKALEISGWFETPEQQIEVLKLAIKLRGAHKALTHAGALIHLCDLGFKV